MVKVTVGSMAIRSNVPSTPVVVDPWSDTTVTPARGAPFASVTVPLTSVGGMVVVVVEEVEVVVGDGMFVDATGAGTVGAVVFAAILPWVLHEVQLPARNDRLMMRMTRRMKGAYRRIAVLQAFRTRRSGGLDRESENGGLIWWEWEG